MLWKPSILAVLAATALAAQPSRGSPHVVVKQLDESQRDSLTVGQLEMASIRALVGTSREDVLGHAGATFIAVRFDEFDLPPGDEVVVSSPDGSVAYSYADKGRAGGESFFASRIPGDLAVVQYKPAASNSTYITAQYAGYRIQAYARGVAKGAISSICGLDQTVPAKCYLSNTSLGRTLPLAYQRSRAVARLLIDGVHLCTGWLLGSEGHLIINEHCITSPSLANKVDIEFSAESSSCSDQCRVQLGCRGSSVAKAAAFVASSAELDYAILKLPSSAAAQAYRYLQFRETDPVLKEQIYIPQHPNGVAKRITATVNTGGPAVVTKLGVRSSCGANRVAYLADTEGGSSGSPVLAASDNAVIALHNCGGCDNSGVDVRDIIQDLKKKGISIANLVPSTTTTPPPAPGQCEGLDVTLCEAMFFCSWSSLRGTCQRWWK